MATLGSKLLIKEMEWNANMTEQSHLGASLIAKPHRMIGHMDQLFSASNYYSDNPLSSLLMGQPQTEEEIGTTELLSAVNRFNSFNQQLLGNLPAQQQEAVR